MNSWVRDKFDTKYAGIERLSVIVLSRNCLPTNFPSIAKAVVFNELENMLTKGVNARRAIPHKDGDISILALP